jgi:hypothetical protein
MRPQLLERLKDNRLADSDIEAIAQILLDRQAVLSTALGAASTVVSGNAQNSVIAPVVLNIHGCDPIALSDVLVARLGVAVRPVAAQRAQQTARGCSRFHGTG